MLFFSFYFRPEHDVCESERHSCTFEQVDITDDALMMLFLTI